MKAGDERERVEGAQSGEIIIKKPFSSCRASDPIVLHTGGYFKPIQVVLDWAVLEKELCLKPQEKTHLFKVRIKSLSPEAAEVLSWHFTQLWLSSKWAQIDRHDSDLCSSFSGRLRGIQQCSKAKNKYTPFNQPAAYLCRHLEESSFTSWLVCNHSERQPDEPTEELCLDKV